MRTSWSDTPRGRQPAVQAAGLRMKVVHPTGATTLEYGIGRITVDVDEQDRITGLRAG